MITRLFNDFSEETQHFCIDFQKYCMDVRPNKMLHCLQKHKREMAKEDEYVQVQSSQITQIVFSFHIVISGLVTPLY